MGSRRLAPAPPVAVTCRLFAGRAGWEWEIRYPRGWVAAGGGLPTLYAAWEALQRELRERSDPFGLPATVYDTRRPFGERRPGV